MTQFSFALLKGFIFGLFSCLIVLPRLLGWILAGILYFLPESIFRCLPMSIKTPVRQCRRYVTKIGQGAGQRVEIKMIASKKQREAGELAMLAYRAGRGQKCPLSEFLSVYDILLLVTQHLHYVDIEVLGLVSKSVREAVIPHQDMVHRLSVFEKYTCQNFNRGGMSAKCWVCYKQVCGACEHIRMVPQTRPLFHMENCKPYCTRCYHKYVLAKRPAPSQRLTHARCRCSPITAEPSIIMRIVNSSSYYATAQLKLPRLRRTLCRLCDGKTDEDLRQSMEHRAELNLIKGRNKLNQVWKSCTNRGCNKALGPGPRWWVCGGCLCGFECRSLIHQAWSFRNIGTGEHDVGEQAV